MDFECPFCAKWSARVDSLIEEYPTQVQLVVHHYPLSIHANATSAAVAAECAHQQKNFREFQRIMFAQQSQLGEKPWIDFAAESAMPDLERFEHCMALPPDSFPRIAHGMELGKSSGVRGTPTVWINGLIDKPSLAELRKMTELIH